MLAGLEVIRFINEPMTVALAYGMVHVDNPIIAFYDSEVVHLIPQFWECSKT
jgi:molecular chaperone DnaK (HSP70)